MALVLGHVEEFYSRVNNDYSDPRVKEWLFMSDPFTIVIIVITYLYFVLKIGPVLMKNRAAFNIDQILKYYNIFQVVVCAGMFFQGFRYSYGNDYSILCQPMNYSPTNEDSIKVARVGHVYFLVKVLDLLDTVFFIMRKKQNQITFLHVFHHSGDDCIYVLLGMVISTWVGTKYFAGGHAALTGLINCVVHVIMYFYYYLTIVNPEYKRSIWWKKHITQIQMVQFGLIAIHWFTFLIQPKCTFPKWPAIFILPQNFYMFYLFSKFYMKTYSSSSLNLKKNDDYKLKTRPYNEVKPQLLSYDNTLI